MSVEGFQPCDMGLLHSEMTEVHSAQLTWKHSPEVWHADCSAALITSVSFCVSSGTSPSSAKHHCTEAGEALGLVPKLRNLEAKLSLIQPRNLCFSHVRGDMRPLKYFLLHLLLLVL